MDIVCLTSAVDSRWGHAKRFAPSAGKESAMIDVQQQLDRVGINLSSTWPWSLARYNDVRAREYAEQVQSSVMRYM